MLGKVEPTMLSGLLYAGSGLCLLIFTGVRQATTGHVRGREAGLVAGDIKWLIAAILAGGIAAPIILLFSLRHTDAAVASLLLNFEGVATTVIAALVFQEAIDRRVWWAIALITLASILLSTDLSGSWSLSLGALGVLLACVFWGIDNNVTRNISAKDPLTIVTIKGLGAGLFSMALGLALGNAIPNVAVLLGAVVLGGLSYGLSIVLFIHAMRQLGAGRTSALFGTAPLAGIALSFALFREAPMPTFFAALPLMVVGTLLLLGERHRHTHAHLAVRHEHRHEHSDGHHDHTHDDELTDSRAHSHTHEHVPLVHTHAHTPDTHHRHGHEADEG